MYKMYGNYLSEEGTQVGTNREGVKHGRKQTVG
jgi:hypothetical protein